MINQYKRITTNSIKEMKLNGEKISMLTAYDYTLAKIIDQAGIEIILVGDYARGNDSGLIEVFLIGKELNMEYIAQLEEKIENLIGRKVSFYLASKFLSDRDHIVLFKQNEK